MRFFDKNKCDKIRRGVAMKNVLVIEDNPKVNKIVTKYIKQEGHRVFSAFSAEEGLEYFENNEIHLVITDLMLPGMQGEVLVEKIRENSKCFIIILTAKIHLDDKISGLKIGADDYIVKPFATEELILKVNNFLSRTKDSITGYSFYNSELEIFDDNNIVKVNGKDVELTSNEFKVLNYLRQNNNRIYSRDQLLDHCFGNATDVFDRVIDVYIKNIRKKIGDNTKNPKYIKTIYGLGYMFVGEPDV